MIGADGMAIPGVMMPAGLWRAWRARAERRRAERRVAELEAMRCSLLDWAEGSAGRAAGVEELLSAGLLDAIAAGRLARWFPRTTDLAMAGEHELMVTPDLVGLGRALDRDRVGGTARELMALRRFVATAV